MSDERILTNGRIVLADRVLRGTVTVRGGRIRRLDEGRSALPSAHDLEGDHLLPGLVDLHSDSLEGHLEPRRGIFWDGMAAAAAHDAVAVAAGITTVFDAVCIGQVAGRPAHQEPLEAMLAGLEAARKADSLRADHRLHLRCEVTDPQVMRYLEPRLCDDRVSLISVMDHAPGHRQMKDASYLREVWMIGTHGMSSAEADRELAELGRRSREVAPAMREQVAAAAHARGIALASHDDETEEHIALAARLGVVIAEFPTTERAAREARRHGIAVLMGAPNLVRGGSHSGNVAAGALARAGLLDALMSDYVMSSMAMGALALAGEDFGLPLAQAVAAVSARPARIVGLDDRGRIEEGLAADLVQMRTAGGRPDVRAVWRRGRRVY